MKDEMAVGSIKDCSLLMDETSVKENQKLLFRGGS